MRNLIIAAVALACIASAGSAQAQSYYYRDNSPHYIYRDNSPPSRLWEPRADNRFTTRENSRYINCRDVNNMPSFRTIDRNGDGYLSGWEFRRMNFGWNTYHRLDLNTSGFVSRNEFQAARRSCD